MKGSVRVGELVRPRAARWTGGWGNELDILQLQVCRSRAGDGCVVISDSLYENGCPGAGAVLGSQYRGFFLRVVDQRIGRDTAFPAIAYLPGHVPVISPGPDAAAAVFGRIAATDGPPAASC